MSSEIQIVAPQSIQETEQLAVMLAKSALLPDALRGKTNDIIATILTGAELGLAPMQSVRGIQIIKGKPTLSADTMGALCKRRPDICEHLTLKESTPTRVTYATKRKGEVETTMSFTIEDAQRAGLAGTDTYKKFPAAMLKARCLSAICRAVYPDLCLGLYDPDELRELPPESPPPPPAEKEINPAPSTATTQTDKVAAKVAAKVSQAAPPATPPKSEKRIPVVECDANGKPLPTVWFGPLKHRVIRDLKTAELGEAIAFGEEKLANAQGADWAASVSLGLGDLKREYDARVERAIEAETAAKANAAAEPGAEG